MLKRFGIVAAVAAGLCLSGTQAMAQFTKDELKCESGTAKALGKQVSAQSTCTSKCIVAQRKTTGPYGPCFDETTLPCIIDPVKGPAAKASASIGKACVKDCPECYNAQNAALCTNGTPLVQTTTALVDTQGPLVYCIEAAAGTPTKDEAKCEDTTVKTLVKYVASINKCYDKCVKDSQAGKLPAPALLRRPSLARWTASPRRIPRPRLPSTRPASLRSPSLLATARRPVTIGPPSCRVWCGRRLTTSPAARPAEPSSTNHPI
jgi:hypothetical protein